MFPVQQTDFRQGFPCAPDDGRILWQEKYIFSLKIKFRQGRVRRDVGQHRDIAHIQILLHIHRGQPVGDGSHLLVHDQLVRHFFNGPDDLRALAAGIGDEKKVRHLLHDTAVDLLDARLSVDDHIVKIDQPEC